MGEQDPRNPAHVHLMDSNPEKLTREEISLRIRDVTGTMPTEEELRFYMEEWPENATYDEDKKGTKDRNNPS